MLFNADTLLIVVIALVADAVIGDPDAIWRRWPHPVTWIGRLIGMLDTRLNRETDGFARRRISGVAALLIVLAISGAAAFLIERTLRLLPLAPLWIGLAGSVLIAQKSLYDHVARVRDALITGGLPAARKAIAMVVGRDPESLDEPALARAAIETTAENFSDGVVAPVFWFCLLGLPGIVLYKAINTADSMIGHRSERHNAFGWAAARLDDLVNLIPARIAGGLIALATPLINAKPRHAMTTMLSDARLHRSPNAGWPEAAMAGGLGIALAGPRRYPTHVVDDPYLNASGRRDIGAEDIDRALKVMAGACGLQGLVILLVALMLA